MNEVSPFLARLRRGSMRREPLAPTPFAADASGRWRASRPAGAWPFGASVFASLLIHAGLVAALLLWADPRPMSDPTLPPPSFDMVFEGGQPERSEEEPAEGLEAPPLPVAPPMPDSVPPPPAVPAPPPVPAPVESPIAEVPLPVPAPAPPPALAEAPVPRPPTAPPPPQPPDRIAPVPPVAAPPPPPPLLDALPAPQPPRLALPPRPEPPPPVLAQPPPAVEFVPPTALQLPDRFDLPLPPAQAPPPPRQQAQPRPAPRPPLPGITVPEGFQLGGRSAPPAGRPRGRGLDTSLDPRFTEGRPTTDPMARVIGAQVGADWRAAFRRWLEENIHYPIDAAQRGEDGAVRVTITASPDGTVRGVRMTMPSTSPSLNSATSRPFNGARLPAFPANSDPTVTIELTVNYVLIRGR
ncbi:TonB family protein [Sabulicella rubraurantiaca]|uniref:TonB family protein n=1 Tax=Sabulicella rubraurantiaca TaxID=2811429 RepID=UPI001A96BB96|nr:TonB family protein [Sabulicella rubraurantiaca]